MKAFDALSCLDSRSLHHLNDAYLILVPKKEVALELGHYRPICLTHSFGKIFAKALANRLSPNKLNGLLRHNQSASIKKRHFTTTFSMFKELRGV